MVARTLKTAGDAHETANLSPAFVPADAWLDADWVRAFDCDERATASHGGHSRSSGHSASLASAYDKRVSGLADSNHVRIASARSGRVGAVAPSNRVRFDAVSAIGNGSPESRRRSCRDAETDSDHLTSSKLLAF